MFMMGERRSQQQGGAQLPVFLSILMHDGMDGTVFLVLFAGHRKDFIDSMLVEYKNY
jgi:hypothetical protein